MALISAGEGKEGREGGRRENGSKVCLIDIIPAGIASPLQKGRKRGERGRGAKDAIL